MMRALSVVVLALVATSALPARAQDQAPLSLKYELNASQVAVGETFQLDVILTVRTQDPVEELSLPDLPRAFTVLQERRGSSTQMSAVNGRRTITIEQRYMYLLRADEAGTFRIPEATARLGKSIARATAVVVRVLAEDGDGGAAPAPGEDRGASGSIAGARFGKDPPPAFLEVTLDKTSAWVGQQLTATTEVYSQQPLAQWPRLPPLKPPGFFCTSLVGDDRPQPSTRTIGGRTYYVYLVNKDALFPLGGGKSEIPAMTVDLVPAGSMFGRARETRVRSAPLSVEVKELPAEGQPSSFSPGNVGHWKLDAAVRPSRGALGEPLTLTLAATGTGSLEQLVLPTWNGSGDQARVFPATTKRVPRATTLADPELGGRVVVELLVQPQAEGQLRIPPFTLTTFNPDTGTYQESTTAAIVVPIGGTRSTPGASSSSSSSGARQVIAKGARPLKRGLSSWSAPGDGPVMGAVGTFGVGLAVLGVGALRRRQKSSAAGQRASLRRDRQKALDDARARGDLAALQRVLLDVLAEQFGPAVKAASTSELEALLADKGVDAGTAGDIVKFIRDVEAARYMKGGAGEREELARRAEAILGRVEGA